MPERTTPLNRLLAGCEAGRGLAAATGDLAFGDVCTGRERLRMCISRSRSFISLVMPVDDSDSLEVGLVGNEGMFGHPSGARCGRVAGERRRAGRGNRLAHGGDDFCRELERSQALQGGIDRYVFVYLSQLAQRAACTRFHSSRRGSPVGS